MENPIPVLRGLLQHIQGRTSPRCGGAAADAPQVALFDHGRDGSGSADLESNRRMMSCRAGPGAADFRC